MKAEYLLAGLAAVLGGVLGRECFSKHETPIIPVPTIITVHDTVHEPARIVSPKLPPMANIVLRVTFHTPSQIPVNEEPAARPNLWPILSAEIGGSRGDTSRMTTFSLRSGQTAVSNIWTPGPLRGVWADSTMTPKLLFGEPLRPRGVSLWTKLKWTGVGYGLRTLQNELQPRCH